MRPAGERARDAAPSPDAISAASSGSAAIARSSSGAALPAASARALRLLDRSWRIAGTGFSFVVFGIGALLLALFVFPICHLLSPSRPAAEVRVQRVVQRAYRFFVGLMESLGLIRTRWIGLERLHAPGAKLVVANHPSLIDVVHLIARLPQADCVVGDAWARNAWLGLAARRAGYLTNARGAEVVAACAERLRAGRTVVLFPEGTRSPEAGMQRFQRGAAHAALVAGAPIVPVAIRCEPRMLMKGRPFWAVPERPAQYTLRVLEPVDPRALAGADAPPAIAARRVTSWLRARLAESGA
ncbi:MAG TPA: lysophospholipid acyltransferase family protein [Myxococcota bacterium]|nr:lysophospholipid acyltransferase family protein [Myxococcota bacterium]